MNRGLLAVLTVALVVSMIPLAGAQEDEEADEKRCITPPDVEPSYEWAYELSNGRTRYVEVVDKGPATTPRGHHNVTTFEFAERNENNETKAWGQVVRYGADSPYPWALTSQDRWERTSKGELRRMDSYDPPFSTIHGGLETCPGDFWRFTTHHTITYGQYGQAGNEQANETWQVRAHAWTNVTVPEGTHEVLPIVAVREADGYQIITYWSPEVRAPAMIEQGPNQTTELTRELSWFILDQRPTPIFEVTPLHAEVGDVLTLNGTASWDPEGNITEYRWHVDGETYFGPVVELNATEEKTVNIRLFVTDEANRTTTLGTTRYIAPEGGGGVGVSGPTEAYSGRVVTLEAHASFDPVEVRWRQGDTVVGQGETFQFRMEETRNLSVDAFHETGRVYTTNHTVELVERSPGDTSGSGDGDEGLYPPGATDELAILEPLEGQLVPKFFEATVRAKQPATLTVDQRPVWQGTAETTETVSIGELDTGKHTLTLSNEDAEQTVNITVAADGTRSTADEAETTDETDANASSGNATPAPSAAFAVALAALVAVGLRRRDA